jgi:hypothetical protein
MPRPRTAPRRSLRSPGFVSRAFCRADPRHQPSPPARGKCRRPVAKDLGRYRRRAAPGVRAGGGERAALPGEPSRASGDLTNGSRRLLGNLEEQARADSRFGQRGAWPGLSHRRAGERMTSPTHDASARQHFGEPFSGLGPNDARKDRLRNQDLAKVDGEIARLVDEIRAS